MYADPQLLYKSSNGDAWYVLEHQNSAVARVRHVPAPASGGRTIEQDIDTFVAHPTGPEHGAALAWLKFHPAAAGARSNAIARGRPPISAAQVRAARGLLNWSQHHLAEEAHLEPLVIARLELEDDKSRLAERAQVAAVLEAYGVIFIGEGETTVGGPGVRMGALGTSTGRPGDNPESRANDNQTEDGAENSLPAQMGH